MPCPAFLQHDAEHRFDFSFSGLKTAVLNLVRQLEREGQDIHDAALAADLAASFQDAVADVLVEKTAAAAKALTRNRSASAAASAPTHGCANWLRNVSPPPHFPLYYPPLSLCTDNAAMIAAAAYYRSQVDPHATADLGLDVFANLPLPEEGA